jgi:hypothetical protein
MKHRSQQSAEHTGGATLQPLSGAVPEERQTDELLLEVQHRAVRFFWEQTDDETGLAKDRANNFNEDSYKLASLSGTGYALAALPIAVEHGWLDRKKSIERALMTLGFVRDLDHVHGWLPHFVELESGERLPGQEVSTIDTALFFAGALVCARYFGLRADGAQVEQAVADLFDRLDWLWMLTNGGSKPEKKVISHGWTPEHQFLPYNYADYSEAILLLLLGLGAEQEPLPPTCWDAVERRLQTYAGIESIEGDPIFIHQMPFGYFDFRNCRDRLGYDYSTSSANAMRIHHRYCEDHRSDSATFAAGFWGLNASDGPDGYRAYGAPNGPSDGTVSPTGAIGALPFDRSLGVSALHALASQKELPLWGRYGFSNSFNLDRHWATPDVIGIDLGMVLLAIENYRTGLVWKLMGSTQIARRAVKSIGLKVTAEPSPRLVYVPTPAHPDVKL